METLYATAANFGCSEDEDNSSRPWVIQSVSVPVSIKRKWPSKHYVYKVAVEWSNGTSTVIYRRYSLFFDFLVKLQELVSSLTQAKTIDPSSVQLPELPGKGLFSRRQTHQVAEKRRKKIEEFCQQLILLPPEISESTLVLGFFNTWPDDTMPKESEPTITSPIIASSTTSTKHKPLTSALSTPSLDSPTSPTSDLPTRKISAPVSDAIISHPDEMEHLEQYQVLANYQRKDSHQVNLFAGQVVHVIEKHDTGWWMVMTEDEQGYAPAAYLEALEESSLDRHPENATDEVYEAMETYVADGDDEVGFRAGDRIEVISKSMDGWWKIRCNGKVGYSPAALIRRKVARSTNKIMDLVYESEKTIYEELNIHKPPPRRNTIDKSILRRVKPRVPPGYDSPRSNNILASKRDEQIYVDPVEEESDNEDNIYKIPRPISDQPKANGTISPYTTINHTQSAEPLDTSSSIRKGSSTDSLGSPRLHRSQEKLSRFSPDAGSVGALSKDPEPVYESAESLDDDGPFSPVYENTEFGGSQKSPPPEIVTSPQPYITPNFKVNRNKPRRHTPDDYEDLDDLEEPFSTSDKELNDVYEDMDGHLEEQTKKPARTSLRSLSSSQSVNSNVDDYEDMDSELANRNSIAPLLPALDDYVTMDPKPPIISSPRETAAPVGSKGQQTKRAVPLAWRIANSSAIENILKKRLQGTLSTTALPSPSTIKQSSPPPLPPANSSSEATKPKNRFPFTKSASVSHIEDHGVFEDEYVEMDPLYSLPPPEEIEEEELNNSSEEPTTKATSPAQPISSRPLPPPPYALIETKRTSSKSQSTSTEDTAPAQKKKLTRAKSVEHVLSSPPNENIKVTRQFSPPAQQPKKNNRVPPLPPPRVPVSKQLSSSAVDNVDGAVVSRGGNAAKPLLPGRVQGNNKPAGRPFANGHHRDGSPETHPCDLPPVQKPRLGTPGRESSPAKRSVSPPNLIPSNERECSPHKPLKHTVSEPHMIAEPAAVAGGNFPKTYIAQLNYESQAAGCLSFSTGDKCVLVSQTKDGWWLVNIGGREGWTPGDYWVEDVRNRATIASRPPSVAPRRLPEVQKPRSHTVATDNFPTLPEHPMTEHTSVDSMRQDNLSSSLQLTSNTEKEKAAPLSSSMELLSTKSPPKPPPYSKTGKAKGPPPPKPRPLQNQGSSPGVKRKPPIAQKPVLPPKPTNARISPHVSPTPPANATPSPPPPLPPANLTRKRGSQDGQLIPHDMMTSSSTIGNGGGLMVDGEYVMLKDTTTSQTATIESAPWFVGKMDRGQAEQFLMEHGRQREFLVRERTAKEGFYALSIRHHYSCKHFNIDPTHDHQYSMGTLTFSTIDEIIRHYQQNSLFIHDGQHVTLGQPVKRRVRHSDAHKPNANVFC